MNGGLTEVWTTVWLVGSDQALDQENDDLNYLNDAILIAVHNFEVINRLEVMHLLELNDAQKSPEGNGEEHSGTGAWQGTKNGQTAGNIQRNIVGTGGRLQLSERGQGQENQQRR